MAIDQAFDFPILRSRQRVETRSEVAAGEQQLVFARDVQNDRRRIIRCLGARLLPHDLARRAIQRRNHSAEHHQIVLVDGRSEDSNFNPINQISFFVQDLEELQTFYLMVKAAYVSDLQPITHGNAWSVYFRDPEGNRIEVYTHTPWYVNQPLREPLDLRLSIQEIQENTEAVCRALPGFQTRAAWLESMQSMMGAKGG